jgi:hypothetical protein
MNIWILILWRWAVIMGVTMNIVYALIAVHDMYYLGLFGALTIPSIISRWLS